VEALLSGKDVMAVFPLLFGNLSSSKAFQRQKFHISYSGHQITMVALLAFAQLLVDFSIPRQHRFSLSVSFSIADPGGFPRDPGHVPRRIPGRFALF